jgi:transposase-like protein
MNGRVPMRRYRRLDPEQRDALDRLEFHRPGPAERARLKILLGWKRIPREERAALARELLADGMVTAAVADLLSVTDRHLRRLLAETAEKGSDPLPETAEIAEAMRPLADITSGPKVIPCPGRPRPPMDGFATFQDLDRWLEEQT